MSREFARGIQDMFVCENFFMLCTQWTRISMQRRHGGYTRGNGDELIWRGLLRWTSFDRLFRMKNLDNWIWGVTLSPQISVPFRIRYPTWDPYIETCLYWNRWTTCHSIRQISQFHAPTSISQFLRRYLPCKKDNSWTYKVHEDEVNSYDKMHCCTVLTRNISLS